MSARNYRRRDEENVNEQKTRTNKVGSSGFGAQNIRKNLPAILRKVMAAKFPEFDEYQLAKYNKNKRRPKNNQNIKVRLILRKCLLILRFYLY